MSIEADARAEAEKRYPSNHLVNDPFGETGEAWSDPFGYNEEAQRAFVAGAEWQASRLVTDAEADAAQTAFHDYCFGPDEPLTARDIGITRQAWKVAIEAARALADKETP